MRKNKASSNNEQVQNQQDRSTNQPKLLRKNCKDEVGAAVLLVLYLFVVGRSLVLAYRTQDSYSRLLVGSLALTFFFYVFVNTAMVTGVLPVVGIPLPLISYGGTSMVTLMAAFGIIMGACTHRRVMS